MKNIFHLLFILAFSSSVRCSVLVLITTFTLFTLKTCENNQNQMSYAIISGFNLVKCYTSVMIKMEMQNFCEPLLQIRWPFQFCHFSSPKSQTCFCKNKSIITGNIHHHRSRARITSTTQNTMMQCIWTNLWSFSHFILLLRFVLRLNMFPNMLSSEPLYRTWRLHLCAAITNFIS